MHNVYDTLTVAGLELGLLWVGSFHCKREGQHKTLVLLCLAATVISKGVAARP